MLLKTNKAIGVIQLQENLRGHSCISHDLRKHSFVFMSVKMSVGRITKQIEHTQFKPNPYFWLSLSQ